MDAERTLSDRDMRDVRQAMIDCANELDVVSSKLYGTTRHEYLADEMAAMEGVRVKLTFNIRKLKRMTGQSPYIQENFPF